jgi:ABC-type lipoprotein export system ATPase subunit
MFWSLSNVDSVTKQKRLDTVDRDNENLTIIRSTHDEVLAQKCSARVDLTAELAQSQPE